MAKTGGFWSYVHADDEADRGRIAQLARDVVAQYEMLTADSIDLFLDRDDIEWGDEWKPKIDSALESVVFFVAVLSPRYFQSVECRRELNFFARRATRIGMKELVLPILYVDFPALHEDPCRDDAIALARSFQWVDWTALRYAALDSPEYRRAVSSLAQRLADASASTETVENAEATAGAIQDEEDEGFGFMERLARMEETMPEFTSTMDSLTAEIYNISEITAAGGEKLQRGDAEGRGFGARLLTFNAIAQELDEPVTRIAELSNEFTAQLHEVDLGVKTIIERIPQEINESPDSRATIESFLESFRSMIESAEEGLGEMEKMAAAIEPVEKGSRSARPIFRKLRKAVTVLAEGGGVTREWERLFDELEQGQSGSPSTQAAGSP